MRSHFWIQRLFWLVLFSCASCGSKPGTPTADTTSPTGPTAPLPVAGPPGNLVVVPQQRNSQGSIYELRWTAPSGSVTSFAVEVGSSTRASVIGVFEAPSSAAAYSLTTQHRGPVFVRVRARNAGGLGDPSNEFRGTNELVILDVADGQPFCGTLGCGGGRLAPRATTALFQNAFVIAQRTDAVFGNSTEAVIAHELSHALGLCHIASPIMGEFTLMGTSAIRGVTRLSSVELAAIRSVYGAGLGPGSTRQDLLSFGLVGPR